MRISTWLSVVLVVGLAGAAWAEEEDPGGEVRRMLEERRADLCKCVERGVNSGQLVPVVLKFEINVRGRAFNTEVAIPEEISPTVARCMKRALERIRFPEVTAFSLVEHRMSFLNSKLDRPLARRR